MSTTSSTRITTLCFHGIGQPGRALEDGEERFWIEQHQYVAILDAVLAFPGPVELTFDDSNASDHEYGLTELHQRHLKAQFFLIAGRLGEPGSLAPTQVRELIAAGMSVGNHGLHHRPWRELTTDAEREREILSAGEMIADVSERPIVDAACPRGSYDRRSLETLRRGGYRRVYTVDEGTSRPSAWLRNRYTVIHTDSAESITNRLRRPDGSAVQRADRMARQIIKRLR